MSQAFDDDRRPAPGEDAAVTVAVVGALVVALLLVAGLT